MSLVRVELSRLVHRRAVVLLLVAAALLTALVAGTTLWDTRPVGADELASARAQVQEQVDSPGFEKQLAGCRADPAQLFGPGATGADCARQLTPTEDSYLSRSPLSLDEQRDQGGTALIVVLTALMILLGATFAGADWATGSMGNRLLFEPRRAKVWVAKAVAVTLACLVAAALLLVAFWVSLYLVAESRGIATGATVQGQVRWLAARGVALAAMAGLGGYALTMLLRSTVATMALLFAYTAGGEVLLALAPVDRPGRWSPANNVSAWIHDGVRVFDSHLPCGTAGGPCDQHYTLGLLDSAAYLAVLLVLAVVVSLVLFRGRDVP